MEDLAAHLNTGLLVRIIQIWLVYRVALALYNISPWHPLYRFPGPRLASMTFLYEFWYDFVCHGRYTRQIQQMHEMYGPIVRINPEELHCNDPEFVDEIYASGGRIRDKHQHFLNANSGPVSSASFGSRLHEVHRMRRSAVNKSFSRTQMKILEPEIHELTQYFCDKLLAWVKDEPLDLVTAFSCFTSDTISNYAYGEPLGFLAQDGWEKNYKAALNAFLQTMYMFRFFTPLRHLVVVAPFTMNIMPTHMANLFRELTETLPYHIRRATEGEAKTQGRIFADLLDSNLPDEEKTIYRLSGEGFSLTGAGTETTANTLSVITFYLLTQPETRARLEKELEGQDARNLDWQTLEQLPYLYGVMYEGLRLSYGLSTRLPRIARTENLRYASADGRFSYVVPMGTPIGMSAAIMHHNEDIFPDSHAFRPERWIDAAGQKNLRLEKYMISFSRGSRQCLGMHLALCEMYLLVAALTLRGLTHLHLYETSVDDIKYDHDLMVPQPKKGSKGVRVLIR
ncbi:putative cytochrome P450 [Pestalotiopsis sp. NC0098]|nr:putative cytochrome P450 [Pestalotiopsis sp. NC0098]